MFTVIVKRTLNKERFEEIRKNSQLRLIQYDGYLKEAPAKAVLNMLPEWFSDYNTIYGATFRAWHDEPSGV